MRSNIEPVILHIPPLTLKLPLTHFQDENQVHFVHSPDLDVTGYGNTFEEARQSFDLVLANFIDYTQKKGTLNKFLAGLKQEKQ